MCTTKQDTHQTDTTRHKCSIYDWEAKGVCRMQAELFVKHKKYVEGFLFTFSCLLV